MVALPVVIKDGGVDDVEEKVVVASVNPYVAQELVLQGLEQSFHVAVLPRRARRPSSSA